MVSCISPAEDAISETLRTLDFCNQIKGIKNRPVVQLDPREKLIAELRDEIDHLRAENEELRRGLVSAPALGVLFVPPREILRASRSANAQKDTEVEAGTPSLPLIRAPLTASRFESRPTVPLKALPAGPPLRGSPKSPSEAELEQELDELLAAQIFDAIGTTGQVKVQTMLQKRGAIEGAQMEQTTQQRSLHGRPQQAALALPVQPTRVTALSVRLRGVPHETTQAEMRDFSKGIQLRDRPGQIAF